MPYCLLGQVLFLGVQLKVVKLDDPKAAHAAHFSVSQTFGAGHCKAVDKEIKLLCPCFADAQCTHIEIIIKMLAVKQDIC